MKLTPIALTYGKPDVKDVPTPARKIVFGDLTLDAPDIIFFEVLFNQARIPYSRGNYLNRTVLFPYGETHRILSFPVCAPQKVEILLTSNVDIAILAKYHTEEKPLLAQLRYIFLDSFV